MSEAIGMIETKGYTGSIEATDAKFDAHETRQFLDRMSPRMVTEVEL